MSDDNYTPLEIAPGMADQRLAAGRLAGPAPQASARSWDVDRGACRRMRCPYCRRRGLAYHPFHQGARYRVVGLCHDCGTETEL